MVVPRHYQTSEAQAVKVSVIICSYNGTDRIAAAFDCIRKQSLPPELNCELLFIDNASTDATTETARTLASQVPFPFVLLSEPNPGKAQALRLAFQHAAGEYFCIVDDDNLLAEDYLQSAVSFLDDHSDVAIIAGRYFPEFPPGVKPPADFYEAYHGYLACYDLGPTILWDVPIPGAGMVGRTALFKTVYERIGTRLADRVGAGVGCCEDLEKGEIVRRLGWRTAHVPSLQLRHVMTERRLTRSYIDALATAAQRCTPWLSLISNGSNRVAAGDCAVNCLRELGRVLKYSLLTLLPRRLHPKLGRAPYWRSFYLAKALGYADLIKDRRSINAMLARIDLHSRSPMEGCSRAGRSVAAPSGMEVQSI